MKGFIGDIATQIAQSKKESDHDIASDNNGYYIPFMVYATPLNIAASNFYFLTTSPRYGLIVAWRQAMQIFAGTITALNTWTFELKTETTTLVTYTIPSATYTGVWSVIDIPVTAISFSATPYLALYLTRVGTPPNLNIVHPLIYTIGA